MKKKTRKQPRIEKSEIQYCIEGVLVNEVLADLSDEVTIIGAKITIGTPYLKERVSVPTKLKKMAVTSIRRYKGSQEATLVFDETTKDTILSCVSDACKEIKADPDRASFEYITLAIDDQTAGRFSKTTKEIRPDDRDLRRKLKVLGLSDARGDGKTLSKLLSMLHAHAYRCNMVRVEKIIRLCEKA